MAALRGERVTLVAELPLRGAGGEPGDCARTGFYSLVSQDGDLSWSAVGSGRMLSRADGVRGRRQDQVHADTTAVRSPFTFLFTDIEGSTRLVKQLRERWGDVVGEHQQSPGRLPPTPRSSSLCLGGW
jgi:hypothetical protein